MTITRSILRPLNTGVWSLAIILFALGSAGCIDSDDGSVDSDDGSVDSDDDDSANATLSGTYYAANIGADSTSAWIGFFSVDEENGDTLNVEVLSESDQGPPEGATLSMDYTLDADGALTVSSGSDTDDVGQVSADGQTWVSHNRDVSTDDDTAGLMLGIGANQSTDDPILDGDYFVALVHSPDDEGPNFFTGYYDMTFDGNGSATPNSFTSDQTFEDYHSADGSTGITQYDVYARGDLRFSVDSLSRDIEGVARSDGELFAAVDTIGTPDSPDNTYKSELIGIKKSSNATNALLEGTWEYGCITSANDNSYWGECSGTMTLDSNGNGSYTDTEAGSQSFSLDVSPDGTFAFDSDLPGIVSPSGDVMLIVSDKVHGTYGDYELTVAVKRP